MAEHTPGPWKFVDKDGWSGIETPNGEDLLLYAVCAAGWHGRVTFDNPADARLIAAAPELLEALKELLLQIPEPDAHSKGFDHPPEYATDSDWLLAKSIHQARAAISKAAPSAKENEHA